MKTLGIIPARGGSKGIPGKNLFPLVGKPLLAYSIEAAMASCLNKVVVSTDSKEIAQVAQELGAEAIMRPRSLAQDDTPTLPVVQHAVGKVEGTFNLVTTLQPTSPLRTSSHIDEALALMDQHRDANSLVSVIRVPHNMVPQSIMSLKGRFLKECFQDQGRILRRQDKPTYYARNGAAIYVTRGDCIDRYIFGGKILPFEMDEFSSIDIDTFEDLNLAELILKSQ